MGKKDSPDSAELFIGLVGSVGTDLDAVNERLRGTLNKYGYKCYEVRLSGLLGFPFPELEHKTYDSEYDRIWDLMDKGDKLCEKIGRGDALAVLACAIIQAIREGQAGKSSRRAYILRSLKRTDEVLTLREVYGSALQIVSAYSPREQRVQRLCRRIAASLSTTKYDAFRNKAEQLIQRDQAEAECEFGQNLRDTFPLADIFVNASDLGGLQKELNRSVSLIFGHPFETPTKDEYGMFHARAAALRSSDLSRQVGAAIATPEAQIIAVGTNEVPKYGGGLYWPGDLPDARDFTRGENPNRQARDAIIGEIVGRLVDAGWLKADLAKKETAELVKDAAAVLSNTRLLAIGEFGRTVHAEMAALVDAAYRGVSVNGASLYCTTFPCHACAKHIVAAGIRRVIYIEPYPKSMAAEQYSDSVVVDPGGQSSGSVVFEPFIGVAPRRYVEFFTAPQRQTRDGKPMAPPSWTSEPRVAVPIRVYEASETAVIQSLDEALKNAGIGPYGRGDSDDGSGEDSPPG